MILNTKYFGEVSYFENEIITFKDGIFGFENEKQFLLINFDDNNDTLLCMQSANDSELAFVIVNPFLLVSEYSPNLNLDDLNVIEAEENSGIAYFSICVAGETLENTTVNLRCPIVVNTDKKLAHQFILQDTDYSFKHPFVVSQKKEGANC